MEKYKVIEHLNIDDFWRKSQNCKDCSSKFFEVKLFKDKHSQEYAGTVYFEIIGVIQDSEINNAISEKLNSAFNHVGLYQIFEK